MGIAGFSQSPTFSMLLAPLQSLCARFLPVQSTSARAPAGLNPALRLQRNFIADAKRPGALRQPVIATVAQARRPAANAPTMSRLKIVREFDAAVSPACAGRMVISGRMADVCAELDRMAQREAAGC